MPNVFPFAGETWADICSHNGRWLMASCKGNRLLCRDNVSIRWNVAVDVLSLGVRCAADHIGRVAAVGKRQDNGFVTAVFDGTRLNHPALNQNVAGNTGVCVTYDFNSHEWLVWRMHDKFTRAKLRIDPNPPDVGEWEYEDISDQLPEGTVDGFSYTVPGPDGYAIPQFALLTSNQVPGLLKSFPAGGVWVGQHPSDPPRLRGFQAGVGFQTLNKRACEEPRAVEYAPGKIAAVSFDPPAHTATVVEFETPLTPDPRVEYPIVAPDREFDTGVWHHEVDYNPGTGHPDWGHLIVASSLDVVTDRVPLKRRSIVNPIILPHVDPALVRGLIVHEPETPARAMDLAEAAIRIWSELYHHLPRPPVCCCVSQRHRDQNWESLPKTLIGVWIPELYFDIPFPDDPESFIRQQLESWKPRLGTNRPWVPTVQAYDRNGSHRADMDEVRRLRSYTHNELVKLEYVRGSLDYNVNAADKDRTIGGMVTYPFMANVFADIASVCTPPDELAPSEPPPTVLPNVELLVSKTTVELEERVNFEVRLFEGSGPVHEIEWYEDTVSDGQKPELFDRTSGLTNKFWWDTPGTYAIEIHAKGPAGAQVVRSPDITVKQKEEEPEMALPNDEQAFNAMLVLAREGYARFLNRPEGIFASPTEEDVIRNPHPDKQQEEIDGRSISVWLLRYASYFQKAPSNLGPVPSVDDYALRHMLWDIYNSHEAQVHREQNPNKPELQWPPEWELGPDPR